MLILLGPLSVARGQKSKYFYKRCLKSEENETYNETETLVSKFQTEPPNGVTVLHLNNQTYCYRVSHLLLYFYKRTLLLQILSDFKSFFAAKSAMN